MFTSIPPITRALLVANLVIYFLYHYTQLLHVVPLELYGFSSQHFRPHQLFSYMFLHAHFWHLFGNMFGLFVFGALLEQVLGSNRYLALYLVCGIGAGLAQNGVKYWEQYNLRQDRLQFMSDPNPANFKHFVDTHVGRYRDLNPEFRRFMELFEEQPSNADYIANARYLVERISAQQADIPTVGASGAIFGIIMAFALLFPNLRLMLLIPPIPIRAKYLVMIYAIFELYALIQQNPNDNVAHFAHLSGMIFAFILIKYWRIPRYH